MNPFGAPIYRDLSEKMFHLQAILLSLSVIFTLIPFSSVKAQLLPDNTLGKESSVINPINSIEDRIDGGAIRGSNLFHSFKELNIDSGKSVYFNNPDNIQNIFTRVTGNNQSQILGNLGILGDANLFLINPNGIIFGKDATLDINGLFIGTTASHINFADGKQFAAVSPENTSLLSISAPQGLGMINNADNEQRISTIASNNTKTLELESNNTTILVSGDILLRLRFVFLKAKSKIFGLGYVASGSILSDSNQQIAAECGKTQTGKFTVTGRGGLPESPNQLFVGNTTIVDLVDLVANSENKQTSVTYNLTKNNTKKEIIEAQGWIVNAEGNIEFVAEIPEVIPHSGVIGTSHCQTQAAIFN